MKKLLFTLVVALAALSASAQKVSYSNLMKLAKSKDEAALVKTLKKWKFELGKTYAVEEFVISDWGWGSIKFDKEEEGFSAGNKWELISYSMNRRGLKQVEFVFDLNDNYEEVKGTLKPLEFPKKGVFAKIKKKIEKAGWKLTEVKNEAGAPLSLVYTKNGTLDRITLRREDMGMLRYSWAR